MPSITKPQSMRRRSKSISDIQRSAICRYQRRHPTVSSAAVAVWAEEELGITVSKQAVSRLVKKCSNSRSVNPLNILHNILDEYTGELTHSYKDTTWQHNEHEKELKSFNNNKTDDNIDNHVEVSQVAVKRYIQAWISHLHDTDHPGTDPLVRIAEKHLQVLENTILNNKIQTTIKCYFKQTI